MEYRNPTQHRMTRRAAAHDYTRPGIYHITLHVAEGLGQLLGAVVGSLDVPDGSADAPRVALSPVGQMVEHELLTAIHAHYAMISIQDYVIMPDHLHFIAVVQDDIISSNGKRISFGQVLSGFKVGCNRGYWALLEQEQQQRTKPTATLPTQVGSAPAGLASAPASGSVAPAGLASAPASGSVAPVGLASAPASGSVAPAGLASGSVAPVGLASAPASGSVASAPVGLASASASFVGSVSGSSAAREREREKAPLFSPGFCDVMLIDASQLATQRAYIAGNPRSRLLRMSRRSWLMPRRMGFITALTPAALRGYLQRECPPSLATPDALAAIQHRLLLANGFVACDTFGNRSLLTEHRCLPVVCHRKHARRFAEQQHRCIEEAARGAVLVSACISPHEREIINECVNRGFATITIHDNGFPDRYHPSEERLRLCAESKQLLVSPWVYQYRGKNEQVTVPFCKTMNCVAQAICRTKDTWWQQGAQEFCS